jgi:hypothetical protein
MVEFADHLIALFAHVLVLFACPSTKARWRSSTRLRCSNCFAPTAAAPSIAPEPLRRY